MVLTFDLLKSKPLSSSLHAHTLYIHVLDLSLIKICFVIGVTKSQGRQAENIMPQSQLCWRRHYKKKKIRKPSFNQYRKTWNMAKWYHQYTHSTQILTSHLAVFTHKLNNQFQLFHRLDLLQQNTLYIYRYLQYKTTSMYHWYKTEFFNYKKYKFHHEDLKDLQILIFW